MIISPASAFATVHALLRWRPAKAPKRCTLDQVKQKKVKRIDILA
jgi:hypothetical protein